MRIASLCITSSHIAYTTTLGAIGTIKADRLPASPSLNALGRRCAQLLHGYRSKMVLNPPAPELVVVRRLEIPTTGNQVAEMVRQHQMQGVFAEHLASTCVDFVEIDVKVLHLFAVGQEGAQRSTVTHSAVSRIQQRSPGARTPSTDDEAHAWHLRQMGLVAHGLVEPVAGYQLEAVARAMVFA